MSDGVWFLLIFVIVAVLGVRGSWRLTRRYRDVQGELTERERSILFAFVIVSWTITFAALYFGGLTVRNQLGFERLPQLAPVSAFIATVILLIPAFLDWVVERVARVPWR